MVSILSVSSAVDSLVSPLKIDSIVISGVEFSCEKKAELHTFLTDALGFLPMQSDCVDGSLINGRLQVTFSEEEADLSDERAAEKALVRSIGLSVGDLSGTIARVEAAGGQVLEREKERVLVQIYPGLLHWLSGSQSLSAHERPVAPTVVSQIDHVAICVPKHHFDLVIERYRKAFDLHVCHTEYVATGVSAMNSTVLGSAYSDTKLVFMQPQDGASKSQIQMFIDDVGGAGVQHIALQVNDIVNVSRLFSKHDISLLNIPERYYADLGERGTEVPYGIPAVKDAQVLVDTEDNGVLMQAFTKPVFGQGSFFFELIERRNSPGFGSGNIKALFRAVERDQALKEEM